MSNNIITNVQQLSSTIDDYDEYDNGIDNTDLSVRFIETNNGVNFIKDDEIENSFFVGINGGSLINLEDKEIYSKYKRLFVLCMKDLFEESDFLYKIYDPIIKKQDLFLLGKQFVLLQTTLNLLRNSYYKQRGCIVNKEYLNKMFSHYNYKYENSEIVIPMLELTETTANINISLYDKQYGIENIKDMLALTSFYNKKYKKPIMDQLIYHLSELRDSQFWSQPRNCDINMSDVFNNRSFNYTEIRNEHIKMSIVAIAQSGKRDKDIEKVISTLIEGSNKNTDYINCNQQNRLHTDIYTALQKSGKRTYYMTLDDDYLKVKKDDITELLCSIDDEQELYYTFNTFLISKDYCHMVLNNSKILDKIQPLFNKYGPVYKFLIGYAWLCFIIEENIMKTKSLKENRYVFDINTANKLPSFPFVFDDIAQNPYLIVLVDKKIINPTDNAMSLYCIDDFDGYGVCNLEQFKWRFNLFTSGNPNKNIFDGIDWKCFAISGSVIPACLQKKSPLFNCVAYNNNQCEEDKWLSYFNHYYGESDIDMMCNDLSIFGFTDKVHQVIEQIKKNITNYQEEDIQIEPIKSMIIIITKYFFDERKSHFNDKFNCNFTVEDMVKQLGSSEMKEYLYLMYIENKSKFNTMIRKDGKHNNQYIKRFMDPSGINEMNIQLVSYDITKNTNKSILDSDTCFYINDFRTNESKVSDDQNYLVMKIGENIKFKIKSKKMTRSIELFRTTSSDFFGVVARFHLPCVRAYYQGDNVYILPSCISAMMTGVNIDYKYFAGVRDPIDIINKYRMRGYGVLLTEQEKKHMSYYNNNVKTFGGMFNINKSFGPRELSDKIYHPLVYTQGLTEDIYVTPSVNYIKTTDDLKKYYIKKYNYQTENFGFDLFKFKTINDNGSIMPYSSWIPKAYMEMKTLLNFPTNKQQSNTPIFKTNKDFKKK